MGNGVAKLPLKGDLMSSGMPAFVNLVIPKETHMRSGRTG